MVFVIKLQVTYPDGVTVNLGEALTPTQVKNEPTVTWNATTGQFYTLIFIGKNLCSVYSRKRYEKNITI